MSIFDEIAKGGTARPIAAFMVGREQKRQRERQEQIDTLNEEFKRKQLEQADRRIDAYEEQVAALTAPKPKQYGYKEVKEGKDFVLRRTIDGVIDMSKEGEITRGPRSVVQKQETGPPGSFSGPTNTQLGPAQLKLDEQKAAVQSFGGRAERLLKIARNTQGANTLTGQLTNIGNRILQETKALSTQFGVEFESGDAVFDVGQYEDVFEAAGLATASARVKAGFLGLAVQQAIASGMGAGKALSDNDVRLMLKTIGENQSDPDILQAMLSDAYLNIKDAYGYRADATPDLIKREFDDPGFVITGSKPTTTPELETLPPEEQTELLRLREKYKGNSGG